VKELLNTLKGMKDSAPGPDGITYSFIKFVWTIYSSTLLEAWNYAMEHKCLPSSFQESHLVLIPKAGKDVTELKNWRPITLSNCDLKLITKTLDNRLRSFIANKISPYQTAYLCKRSISENLRIINMVIEAARAKLSKIKICALDASKAFDSVIHEAIRTVLGAYGLSILKDIFNTLYGQQKVRIRCGGRLTDWYAPNKGVKQGDALSCTLFIMIMDLLIVSIENETEIPNVHIKECKIPKVVGYADDITIITKQEANLDFVFRAYQKFTLATGLHLNADKTEVMCVPVTNEPEVIEYMGKKHTLMVSERLRINGIWFDINQVITQKINWDEILAKIRKQLEGWVPRCLSILGKILVIKTFGLSQALYLSRVLPPDETTLKKY